MSGIQAKYCRTFSAATVIWDVIFAMCFGFRLITTTSNLKLSGNDKIRFSKNQVSLPSIKRTWEITHSRSLIPIVNLLFRNL